MAYRNGGEVAPLRQKGKIASRASGRFPKRIIEDNPFPHEDHAELDGTLKAFVFGFNDGLCANTCLMLGMASAGNANPSLVVASGLVGLVAGAASMGAGEWISGTLANSAERGEVLKEMGHLESFSEQENEHFRRAMSDIGFSKETVNMMARDMANDPVLRIKAHCKFELGLEDVWDDSKGEPTEASGSADTVRSTAMMILAFSMGAAVPLIPWIPAFGLSVHVAVVASVLCSLFGALCIGTVVARNFTPPGDHPMVISSQVIAATIAVALVYGIGLVFQYAGGSISAATAAG